tara:strand:+ start:144 stop:419 length:276 start_codon:yes stop_codon:yes gene_type:complete
MTQTVAECLTAATDSVTLINDINSNGSDSIYVITGSTQEEINEQVQRNVDHLEIILAYDGENDTPDVAGSSEDKSSYTSAITTGKAYIAAN